MQYISQMVLLSSLYHPMMNMEGMNMMDPLKYVFAHVAAILSGIGGGECDYLFSILTATNLRLPKNVVEGTHFL